MGDEGRGVVGLDLVHVVAERVQEVWWRVVIGVRSRWFVRWPTAPEWLPPRDGNMLGAWGERGEITAAHHGSVGAWLLWYARSTQQARLASRARFAA
jgi:hypothetical protein